MLENSQPFKYLCLQFDVLIYIVAKIQTNKIIYNKNYKTNQSRKTAIFERESNEERQYLYSIQK